MHVDSSSRTSAVGSSYWNACGP